MVINLFVGIILDQLDVSSKEQEDNVLMPEKFSRVPDRP